jgi:glycerol-3-phosphate dehydrogenase
VRLVKGSHIVTRRLFEHDHAYIFQNPDKRIIFAIPYEHDYTLIGTTDIEYHGDPARKSRSAPKKRSTCATRSTATSRSRSARRRLLDLLRRASAARGRKRGQPSAVTRDYLLELDTPANEAPLLSVFGGKITTFRKLAEEAVDELGEALQSPARSKTWTEGAPLPGGDIANADFALFLSSFKHRNRWLPVELAHRYARAYGTRAQKLLGDASSLADLGEAPGSGPLRSGTPLHARQRMGNLCGRRAMAPVETRLAPGAGFAR